MLQSIALRDKTWPFLLGFILLQLSGVAVLARYHDLSPARVESHGLILWLALAALVTNLVIGFTLRQVKLRHQAQKALAANSARLEEAQRIAKVGDWEWDIAGQRLHWSRELYRIFGRDPARFTVCYQAFFATIHPEDRELVQRAVDRALEHQQPYSIDHRVKLPDGREKIIHEQAELFCDERGKPCKMVGTAQDITDQKRTEEELRYRLNLQALNAEIGMVLTRDQPLGANLQDCCEAVIRHMDAALARIWLIPDHESMLVLAASAGLHTRLDGEFSRLPIDLRTKIGEIAQHRRPIISNQLLNDPQIRHPEWVSKHQIKAVAGYPLTVAGKVIGVMAFFTRHHLSGWVIDSLAAVADIIALGLERKQAENRLQIQARIVEQIRDAIITTDPAGLIITWNLGAERLFGHRLEEARHRPLSFLFPAHEQDFFQSQVIPRVREKLSHQAEIDIQTKGGDRRHADFSLFLLNQGSEQDGGMICYVRDITERRKSEEKIRLSGKFLEETSEAVVITDVAASIIEVNKAFERVTGYSREEVIGRNPRILQSGHYDAEFYREMWNSLLATGHWEGELWSRRKNSELYPKWLSISAVTNQRDRVTHYVAISRDLTAIKQTQDKL